MKSRELLTSLLSVTMLAAASLGQTPDSTPPNDAPHAITAARCQYTPAENSCADSQQARPDESAAQAPQRFPGPACAPRCPMGPRRPTSPPFIGFDNDRPVAIGALIGFGLGAAAGASANTDARGRFVGALFVGSLGALLGAAVGHAAPVFHYHRPSWRDRWPDDDDEAATNGARARPARTGRPAGATPPSSTVNPPLPATATP